MGERFRTFDAAWASFLGREEPLESFYELLPEDASATLDVWLLQPSESVKARAVSLQQAFAHFEWIVPTPAHFMHVTIAHDGEAASLAGIGPFEVAYRRVNCFSEAVVVEVEGDGPRRLAARFGDVDLFLPHVTVGYVREPSPVKEVREALVPVRDLELGTQTVEEVVLCRVPASRQTILRPWTVIERVPLRR